MTHIVDFVNVKRNVFFHVVIVSVNSFRYMFSDTLGVYLKNYVVYLPRRNKSVLRAGENNPQFICFPFVNENRVFLGYPVG